MKKTKFILFAVFISSLINAQQISYGLKGGMLYNFEGRLKEVGKIYNNKGSGNIGWQIGGYTRISLPLVYLQPELLFTKFSRNYKIYSQGETFEEKTSRLDLPVLVGFHPFFLTRLYMGPVLSLNLDSKVTLKGIRNYKSRDLNLGLQIGAGVDLSKFSFDLRWEKGMTPSQSQFIQERLNTQFSIENRPSMLLLTAGYRL